MVTISEANVAEWHVCCFTYTCISLKGGGQVLLIRRLLLLGVFWPSLALAAPQSVDFTRSGTIPGGDNPTYVVNPSGSFSFDDGCVGSDSGPGATFCELEITLRAETTTSGAAPSQGEVLAALVFNVLGTADFRDGPPGNVPWDGTGTTQMPSVLASALEGSGAATAFGEIGLDVSAHWGLNPAIAVAGRGTHALSSIGDLFGGAATLGSVHLFPGTASSVESRPPPPNGARFGIIDANSTSGGSGWPAGPLAYVQDEIVVTLLYTGTLTGVDSIDPLYGNPGHPLLLVSAPAASIPTLSPAGLLVFAASLLGFIGYYRRR